VRAECAGNGRRVDEPRERRFHARQREIIALAVVQLRSVRGGEAFNSARAGLCAEARGDNKSTRTDRRWRSAAGAHFKAFTGLRGADKRRVERHHAAMRFNLSLKRFHVAVRVHDAAFGRLQRRHGVELRFECARFIAAQPAYALDAIDLGLLRQVFERGHLGLLCRHDQLAALHMRDVMRCEKAVERAPALYAEPRFQRPSGIMQAGVDDFRVAGRDTRADAPLALNHNDVTPAPRQRVAARQSNRARANNYNVKIAQTLGLRIISLCEP
jgi:hypothetical protein